MACRNARLLVNSFAYLLFSDPRSNMKFLAILFSILCLIGCDSHLYQRQYKPSTPAIDIINSKIINVYLDKDFSAKEVEVIERVVEEWNYVLNSQVSIIIVPGVFDHTDKEQI